MNAVLTQLQLIASLQCKDNLYYPDGLFASERVWAKSLYKRNDNTAFFSACIGFTLKRYALAFKEEEQLLVAKIIAQMHPAFELYKNKDDQASYNFWQTKPSRHFPGGNFARRFKFFMIPDDIDDSSLIHIIKPHTAEEQLSLKEKMIKYAVGNLKWPDKPVIGYEKFKPYNTFFVKNMPAAFDVCALCNALYFVYLYKLPLNEQDEHSLNIIIRCIAEDDHLNRPFQMSPYYPNSILIIYHVVRLMVDLHINALLLLKLKLLAQVRQLISNPRLNNIEKLLLAICIQKMEPKLILIPEPSFKEKTHFPFFVAGLLGEVSSKLLRKLAFADTTHIKYHSSAYAETLWLEHLLLNRIAQEIT